MIRRATPLLLVWLAACSDDAPPQPNKPAPVVSECAEGFRSDPRGVCIEIAAEECPAGTRPKIGSTTCAPVGWTAPCPSAFEERDGACVARSVPTCAGATRAAHGHAECVDVGSCSGDFPPPGALVVGSGPIDATHFATISAALAAASPKATIAIEAGTYIEDLKIDKPVTLVGRCAAQVKLTQATATEPGILTQPGAGEVTIRGITVDSHEIGVAIYDGATATIEDVVIDGAKGFGLIVDGSSATLRRSKVAGTQLGAGKKNGWSVTAGGASDLSIDDVTIEGGTQGIYAGTADTTITASRILMRGQTPASPNRSGGVQAREGKISIDDATIVDVTGDGVLLANGKGALITARSIAIAGVKVGGSLARGYGVTAFEAGEIDLKQASITGAESIALFARDSGSILSATDVTVQGPASSRAQPDESLTVSSEGSGLGAEALDKATMNLENVAIVAAWGWGMYVTTGGKLNASQSLVDRPQHLVAKRSPPMPFGVGLSANGGDATLDDVAFTHTHASALLVGRKANVSGKGVLVRDVTGDAETATGPGIAVGEEGVVELDASAVVRAASSGLIATKGPGSSIHLTHSAIHHTQKIGDEFGNGAFADNQASILLDGTSVFDNAAIGIAAAGGRIRLASSVVASNPVGVHVQGGSFLVESSDDSDLADSEVRVSTDTKFIENATKVGTGEVPLPEPFAP